VVTRRQARLTERSLAHQEERARLSLEVDLLVKLEERYNSPRLLDRRHRSANYVKENYFVGDDDLLEVEQMNPAAEDVLNFLEELGHLTRLGAVRAESANHRFGWGIKTYWALYESAIERLREESKEPELWVDLERLRGLLGDLSDRRSAKAEDLTKAELRTFVEYEAAVGLEHPTEG
jgi:hypothetical protein